MISAVVDFGVHFTDRVVLTSGIVSDENVTVNLEKQAPSKVSLFKTFKTKYNFCRSNHFFFGCFTPFVVFFKANFDYLNVNLNTTFVKLEIEKQV